MVTVTVPDECPIAEMATLVAWLPVEMRVVAEALVNPARVKLVAPRLIAVEPIVMALLVNDALAMLVKVLAEPLIVLFENVCAVDKSAVTPVLIAMVTADEPL